jgi:guanylate kinase
MSNEHRLRRGLMFVLSSPSGAGKSTLARRLAESDNSVDVSVSVTTRPARPGEVEGREYFFVDKAAFERMADAGDLLEWARVFDNFYGTPKDPVERALATGRDLMFDVDWQGARALRAAAAADVVSVFILPPNVGELERRLRGRAQDADEVIARRMAKSASEISHWDEYDYVIVNDDVDAALDKLTRILHAERLKRIRQTWLTEFVADLVKRT